MPPSTAYILLQNPISHQYLCRLLEDLGISHQTGIPPRKQASSPEEWVFMDPDFPEADRIFKEKQRPVILVGESPLAPSVPFLRLPVAPRALAALVQAMTTDSPVPEWIPEPNGRDLSDATHWLAGLSFENAATWIPELFQYLDGPRPDPAVTISVRDALEPLLNGREELILVGLVQGGPVTRRLCARQVGLQAITTAIPILEDHLSQGAWGSEAEAMIRSLSGFTHPGVRPLLRRHAVGSDTMKALAAIESMKIRADAGDILTLSILINHPEPIRAVNAVSALEEIGSEAALEMLASHLHPEDAQVRKAVIAGLSRSGEMAVPAVLRQLESASDAERIIAALILGAIASPVSIPALIRQSRHQDANVRFAACEAIALIPDPQTLPPLLFGLMDTNQAIVCASVTGLNRFHPKAGASAIKTLIKTRPELRQTLIAAISAMQATRLFHALSGDQDLSMAMIHSAAASGNRRLLHRFQRACNAMKEEATRNECTRILTHAIARIPEEKQRILVAEDSPTMRRFYETLIPQFGYAVETARDGLEALSRLKGDPSRFVMLITDLNMPHKSGIALVRNLRETIHPSLPALMVTTETDPSQEEAARKAGVNGFLKKPFTEASLSTAIAALLSPRN